MNCPILVSNQLLTRLILFQYSTDAPAAQHVHMYKQHAESDTRRTADKIFG